MRAAPANQCGWRLPDLARRDLAALAVDQTRGAWLIGWAEYLLADLRSQDWWPAISAKNRNFLLRRVDATSGELLEALAGISHLADGDSVLQHLVEQAAAREPLVLGMCESLSVAVMVVDLHRLRSAARLCVAERVPSGRQLEDRTAIACDVFRLALMDCGIKDARSADSKMGKAFALLLDNGKLGRSDVRSLLAALANWRQIHPGDTVLYLSLLD